MGKQSAGVLLYRKGKDGLEVFLVHPGGPFFAKKDAGAWSIPKGEYEESEDAWQAAQREFLEETGASLPPGSRIALTPLKQKSGKTVHAWAVEHDLDPQTIHSNSFEMEWPPKSGRRQQFPEVDRAEWVPLEAARQKINPGQAAFLDELMEKLAGRG